jgi:MFS transporter, putative metabolite:H+ symporter
LLGRLCMEYNKMKQKIKLSDSSKIPPLGGGGAITTRAITLAIVVSALGFFVDLYDIMSLAAIGEPSLKAIGVADEAIKKQITHLQSAQMLGMLIGGFLWGVIGDKYGRLKVLFGSIILYSIFTLLNAFVTDSTQYIICRFLAGLGLAGELGAGITLVSEQMKKEHRGLGPAIIAGFGVLGAIVAVIIGKNYDWKTVYIVGGVLGFLLLLLRIGVVESGLFAIAKHTRAAKGSFMIILRNKKYLKTFICILLAGIPGWYVNGVMLQLSNFISKSMGMDPLPDKGIVITSFFIALALGDVLGGLVSQWLKSRKQSIRIFLLFHLLMLILFFTIAKNSTTLYYIIFGGLGLSVGFVIQLFTLAAEQFGTNIRALVTTSGLNLVRGWVIPFTFLFTWINESFGIIEWKVAAALAAVSISLSLWALNQLEETFTNDLEFENP